MSTEISRGPFTIADAEYSNVFKESVDILDERGFPVAEIQSMPILHNWSKKFPKMKPWAEGSDDGRTSVTRTEDELRELAHLFAAAPDLLAACEEALAYFENKYASHEVRYLEGRIRAAVAKAQPR